MLTLSGFPSERTPLLDQVSHPRALTTEPLSSSDEVSLASLEEGRINLHSLSFEALEILLKSSSVDIDCLDKGGRTLLLANCIKYGDPKIALLALKHGADLNHPSYGHYDQEDLSIGRCVPLLAFTDSLYTDQGIETDQQILPFGKVFHVKHHYKTRNIDPKVVEEIILAFKERGVAISRKSLGSTFRWIGLTGRSTPSLDDLLRKERDKNVSKLFQEFALDYKRNPSKEIRSICPKIVCVVMSIGGGIILSTGTTLMALGDEYNNNMTHWIGIALGICGFISLCLPTAVIMYKYCNPEEKYYNPLLDD